MPKKEETVLVQARVPVNVHKWIKEESKKEGLSIAAYLRRSLIFAEAAAHKVMPAYPSEAAREFMSRCENKKGGRR